MAASYIDPYTGIDYSDPKYEVNEKTIAQAMQSATPEGKLALLKNLRSQLDSGKIQTQDFIRMGQPLAQAVSQDTLTLGGRGSKEASRGQAIYQDFKTNSGFGQKAEGHADVVPNLPQKFEGDTRRTTLPINIDPATRDKMINEIPTDIPISSDRGAIEREAIREQGQAQTGLDQRDLYRKNALTDLAGILSKQQADSFSRSIPQVAEDANTAGIFRSTGYGNALAEKERQLTADTSSQLALQGISDRNLTAAGMGDIVDNRLAMQQSGLQRQFTLDDFTKNIDTAKALADASKPQSQGKTGGEKLAGAVQGLGSAAQIYGGIQTGNAGKAAAGASNATTQYYASRRT